MGYMRGGAILRVNLTTGQVIKEPTQAYAKLFIGGRGINDRILYNELNPSVMPLEPEKSSSLALDLLQEPWYPAPAASILPLSPPSQEY